MPDGYLPPVIAQLAGDSAAFIKTLTDAKALLAQWGASEASAKLTADISPLLAQLAKARAAIDAFTAKAATVRVNVDTSGMGMSVGQALLADMIPTRDLRAPAAAAGGRGGRGSILPLLWGRSGGAFGIGAGLAGLGTLGSFAGFGPEHLLTTIAGLGGSAAAGMGGAGLLGLGALGVGAVGMGTDMSGMGQAIGDTKQYTTLQDNLNRAIAVYGKNSKAAALAQYNMNQFLQDLTPAARSAIAATSAVAQGFHAQFDKATGAAEAAGAQILNDAMKTGEAFLSTIGTFAAQNMGIIRAGLQPLESWLKGPGLQIFTQLEQIFQDHLPTAIHAFSQGIELLIKTVGVASNYTGGFITKLDAFLTRANSPTGFAVWSAEIGKLINTFQHWEQLLGAVGHDLRELFKAGAGTGNSLVGMLTKGATQLGLWESSAKGQASLAKVFAAHKAELEQLLPLLATAITTFGKIEMVAAPVFTQAATWVLGLVNALLRIPDVGKILAMGAAIGILTSRLKLIQAVRFLINFPRDAINATRAVVNFASTYGARTASVIAASGRWIANLAVTIGRQIAATAIIVAQYAARAAAATAAYIAENAATLGIIAGVMALVAGIVYLATHWKQVWGEIKKLAEEAWHFIYDGWGKYLLVFLGPTGLLALGLIELLKHWRQIWGTIKQLSSDAWHFIYSDLVQPIVRFFTQTVPQEGQKVLTWFENLPGKIKDAFGDAGKMLLDVGKNIIEGLIHGIENGAKDIAGAIKKVADLIPSWLRKHLGISSPSKLMAEQIGVPIAQGIAVGILRGMPTVHASLGTLSTLARGAAVNSFAAIPTGSGASSPQLDRIERLMERLVALQTQTAANTKATVDAAHGLSSPAGVAAQVRANNTQLVHSLRAGSVR